ncbi:MAG: hypothetical protein JOZ41_02295 [Chloroflexi bacterium]|nr:hypothetical protein [Chloroflexota bacterium]
MVDPVVPLVLLVDEPVVLYPVVPLVVEPLVPLVVEPVVPVVPVVLDELPVVAGGVVGCGRGVGVGRGLGFRIEKWAPTEDGPLYQRAAFTQATTLQR